MGDFPLLILILIIFTIICTALKLGDDTVKMPLPTLPEMAVFMSQCNETYNIEYSYLESLNSSGSFPDETHETPKCYMDCLLSKLGVVTEEGSFDTARAAVMYAVSGASLFMQDVERMALLCAETMREEPNNCERAYSFLRCLMQMQIEKYEENDQSDNQGTMDYSPTYVKS